MRATLASSKTFAVPGRPSAAHRRAGTTLVVVAYRKATIGLADEVIFLADGRVTDHLDAPTPERVIDHMHRLGA